MKTKFLTIVLFVSILFFSCGQDEHLKTERQYRVVAEIEGNGIVEGDGLFKLNTVCTLTATPEMGWTFKGYFSEDGELLSAEKTFTFNILNDYRIKSLFQILENQ